MSSGSVTVCFAGSRATIDWCGAASERILRFLHATSGEGPRARRSARIRATDGAGGTRLVVSWNDEVLYEGTSEGAAAVALMRWCAQSLAFECSSGLLFHAAALSLDGCVLLLPGKSGNGKSTLSAWLAHHGFNYLTDELVCVAPRAEGLEALRRPLHLKGSAVTVLEGLGCLPKLGMNSDQGRIVDLSAAARYVHQESPLRLVVFPRYCSASRLEMARLPKARAGVHLLEHLINARNLPDHGLKDVTLMAERLPAYSLSYSNFDGLVETLQDAIGAALAECPTRMQAALHPLPRPGA